MCREFIIIMHTYHRFAAAETRHIPSVAPLHLIFEKGRPEEELDPRGRNMNFIITNLSAPSVMGRRCRRLKLMRSRMNDVAVMNQVKIFKKGRTENE